MNRQSREFLHQLVSCIAKWKNSELTNHRFLDEIIMELYLLLLEIFSLSFSKTFDTNIAILWLAISKKI